MSTTPTKRMQPAQRRRTIEDAAAALFAPLLLYDTSGDPEVAAFVEELHAQQRGADIALLREFAPQIPEAELEPLGEAIRSSLAGLGLYWLDHPELERERLVAAMRRI